MINNIDIRPYKKALREKFKNERRNMNESEKEIIDLKISENLFNLPLFKNANVILTYVSTEIEVDTIEIINHSLKMGKTVAVPRCIEGTRNMDFYILKSLSQLESGSFGVLEPKTYLCKKLLDFSSGLCIVPALVYDKRGYRLGYGKGYYDRFLSKFNGQTVGISYDFCLIDEIPKGKYDKRLDKIVTQTKTLNISEEDF
ncbi:MAG: 5-formyltetrahydrofolate cyclo-ligase [Oscillospiraceae bacterium]